MANLRISNSKCSSILASPHVWTNNDEPHPKHMRRCYNLDRLDTLRRAGVDSRHYSSRLRKVKTFKTATLQSTQLNTLLIGTVPTSPKPHRAGVRNIEQSKEPGDEVGPLMMSGCAPTHTQKRNYENQDSLKDSSQMTDLIFKSAKTCVPDTPRKTLHLNDSRMMKAILEQALCNGHTEQEESCETQQLDDLMNSLDCVKMSDEKQWRSDVLKPPRSPLAYVIALNPLKVQTDILQSPLSPPRLKKRTVQMNPEIMMETKHLQVNLLPSEEAVETPFISHTLKRTSRDFHSHLGVGQVRIRFGNKYEFVLQSNLHPSQPPSEVPARLSQLFVSQLDASLHSPPSPKIVTRGTHVKWKNEENLKSDLTLEPFGHPFASNQRVSERRKTNSKQPDSVETGSCNVRMGPFVQHHRPGTQLHYKGSKNEFIIDMDKWPTPSLLSRKDEWNFNESEDF